MNGFVSCDHQALPHSQTVKFTNLLPNMAGQRPELLPWRCELERFHPGDLHIAGAGTQQFWSPADEALHRYWWASWSSIDRVPIVSEGPLCRTDDGTCLLVLNHPGGCSLCD